MKEIKNPKDLLLQFNEQLKTMAVLSHDNDACHTAYRLDIVSALITQDSEKLDKMNEFNHDLFMEEMNSVGDILTDWAFKPLEASTEKEGDKR